MAKITINEKEFEVEDGKNLVDAAEENGIEIPHYCYHPGLSVAGQCRMCVVEQEGNSKLQIACNMQCKDGLKVSTESDRVKDAVKWNLEFHLINHPIDCPICDQAGECGLQEYFMEHGKYKSQMREQKVLKEKVVPLGDKITLDKERCILCSRCVRFTQEVSKTADLAIFNRGDRSVIGTVNNEPMKGNYQVNTVDICPVGALTSTDFRFEQRVWFLEEAESICRGCSTGCNVNIHHKAGKHIYRLKPRYNADVNAYWMCDEGRLTYKSANFDKRLNAARLGGVKLPLREAVQMLAAELKTLVAMEQQDEIAVLLFPTETNEDLETVFKTLKGDLEINAFYSIDVQALIDEDEVKDELMMRNDPYPNSRGFVKGMKAHKIETKNLQSLKKDLESGKIGHLLIIAPEDPQVTDLLAPLSQATSPDTFVSLLTPQTAAADLFAQALSIPCISHYEKKGCMINFQGREQQLSGGFRMIKESLSLDECFRLLLEEYKKPTEIDRRKGAQQ
ncbi:MAG: NADH dehydrogenase subunit [Bradymonadales bacterium]|nr:MAG: NADH dehydrogenase subunit [Bradymonadales bacterium]